MCVLVCVHVGHANPRILQPPDLRRRFGLNCCLRHAAEQQIPDKCAQGRSKLIAVTHRKRRIPQQCLTIHQGYVAANSKSLCLAGNPSRLCETLTICHQSGGGQYSRTVQLENCAIDARSQAKVVRVNYQPLHKRECIKLPDATLVTPFGAIANTAAVKIR